MTEPIFDKQDQLVRIKAYLVQGETLFAVFDCKGAGTGFVGITDLRIIFFDQGVLIKHKSMVSLPYDRIYGVAAADDGIIFKTSTITLFTGAGNFPFEFRGSDKAQWAYRFIIGKILKPAPPTMPPAM